ncbi:MAG TPA: hypothetical protein VFN10_11330 [Thermoanaerobaculia bacterium]|nr:hypothetical protein [Thermoanaerobaculia bacterium]
MKKLALFALSMLIAACGSTNGAARPENVAQPTIELRADRAIFFGGANSAPAQIDLIVTNNAETVLQLVEAEISSPGMLEYNIIPIRRTFNEELAPGETRRYQLMATAVRQIDLAPNESLSLRAVVTFGSGNQQFREIVNKR